MQVASPEADFLFATHVSRLCAHLMSLKADMKQIPKVTLLIIYQSGAADEAYRRLSLGACPINSLTINLPNMGCIKNGQFA